MPHIIVNYHQQDRWIAVQLYDFLCNELGEDAVFFGTEKLVKPGDDYVDAIEDHVLQADGMIVLVSSDWLQALHDLNNYNSIAVETALRTQAKLIPVLIDDTQMPSTTQLPPELTTFARRVPLKLSLENFHDDATAIADILDIKQPAQAGPHVYKARGSFTLLHEARSPFIHAITYPFTTDKNWPTKLGSGILISLIPFAGFCVVIGYGMRTIHRIKHNQAGLPEWDEFGSDFSRGLRIMLGLTFQMAIIFLPMLLLMGMALELGTESVEVGPEPFAEWMAFFIFVIFNYAFFIINMTSLSYFAETEEFTAFTNLTRQLQEVQGNFNRNMGLIVNVILYTIILYTLTTIGFFMLVVPGLFMGMAGAIGYNYLIAYWSLKIQTPEKPKNKIKW